jgi:bacterioferritin-associated ferredoxin
VIVSHGETAAARAKRPVEDRDELLCRCFGITRERLVQLAVRSGTTDFDVLKKYYDIGSRCSSCEIEGRDVLLDVAEGRGGEVETAVDIPLAVRARYAVRRLRREYRRLFRGPRRYGLWVRRDQEIETTLVLSNLTFPDDARNANGDVTRFDLLLYDHSGREVGSRRGLTIDANRSAVYRLSEIANTLPASFVGTLFVDFHRLHELGALRPYCRFEYGPRPGVHYHDKYSLNPWPGFILSTHTNVSGQTWHAALSNPHPTRYRSRAVLRLSDRTLTRDLELAPFGATWFSAPEFFGTAATEADNDGKGLFYLESSHRLMAWFFWRKESDGVWIAQHN